MEDIVDDYYSNKKLYTQQQLDDAKSSSRQQAENDQTELENQARNLHRLEDEIIDTEHRLHTMKMRFKDDNRDYHMKLLELTRKLDSLR